MDAKTIRATDRQYRDRMRAARVAQAQALAETSVTSRNAALDARTAAAAPGKAREAAAAGELARRQAAATAVRAAKTPKRPA